MTNQYVILFILATLPFQILPMEIPLLQTHTEDELALIKCVQENAVKTLRSLVQAGADCSIKDGQTPLLHKAILSKNIADLLLQGGADVAAKDAKGNTALHLAVQYHQNKLATSLIKDWKANPEEKNTTGATVLHIAAEFGNAEMAKALLELRVDTEETDVYGRTPLHIATEKNADEVVKLLLKHGAKLDAANKENITPLMLASQPAREGIKKIMRQTLANYRTSLIACKSVNKRTTLQVMINKDANLIKFQDPDTGMTALHDAVEQKESEYVELLLKAGTNTAVANREGATPLHLAAAKGLVEIGAKLITASAPLNYRDKQFTAPLHCAAANGHVAMVQLLVKNGAIVNAKDNSGCTALHRAVEKEDGPMVQALLDLDADIHARNRLNISVLELVKPGSKINAIFQQRGLMADKEELSRNMSPELIASRQASFRDIVRKGMVPIAKKMIQRGANMNAPDSDGNTALHDAVAAGNTPMTELLIQMGASIDVTDKQLRSPLHSASQKGFDNLVLSLLRAGADINAQDQTKATPLHLAASAGKDKTIMLLLEHKAQANMRDSYGNLALHQAARKCDITATHALIKAGANVLLRDEEGFLPVHIAILENPNELVASYFIEKCPLNNGRTGSGLCSLHLAVQEGKNNLLDKLLENGAIANCRTKEKLTPLHEALRLKNPEAVRILVRKHADLTIEATPRDKYGTIKQMLARMPANEKAVFEALLAKSLGLKLDIREHSKTVALLERHSTL